MFTQRFQFITLTLVLGAAVAQGQGVGQQSTAGGSVALKPSVTTIVSTHDGLAAEYRRLTDAATGTAAKATDRHALAHFLRAAIAPQLQAESFELFTAFDSVVGGGYAVPATLFDLDAIGFLVKEIERTASGEDRTTFATRSYALSVALEGYFTKVQLLVLPVLKDRLSGPALEAVLARVERQTP